MDNLIKAYNTYYRMSADANRRGLKRQGELMEVALSKKDYDAYMSQLWDIIKDVPTSEIDQLDLVDSEKMCVIEEIRNWAEENK